MADEESKKPAIRRRKTGATAQNATEMPPAEGATKRERATGSGERPKMTPMKAGAPAEPTARAKTPSAAAVPSARGASLISKDDLYLFNEGTHHKLHEKLGAHAGVVDGVAGVFFGVWAPDAGHVSVIGDFNDWNKDGNFLRARGSSGIWEGFIPGLAKGTHYKYHIRGRHHGYNVDKADPFAFMHEMPPKTASIVWDLEYQWNDESWMRERGAHNALDAPMSVYELHLGSWRRSPDTPELHLGYRDLAPLLAEYVKEMGFTHVELLPIMEHPFYGSWGYQTTGYFAPTSRYGTPQDLMFFVDYLHQNGIGVILDWVPSHFPGDEHGLAYFDGTHLFEHADPRQGFHPDWKSYIFNYGRNEVRSFLLSSAVFWLERFHADGLRVDAVASMLYLDYSRNQDEWIPNKYGGRENLEAIDFLRRLNSDAYAVSGGIVTVAEESTAWPMVSRPTYVGGLGFGMKWDMGWMHDTLRYISHEPVYRRYHHGELTFRMLYAFTENFVLPLSHDEVVHGKGSLLGKMPGDDWQKFANLRLLFAYMYGQPGKKLLFMGAELAQWREWSHDESLDWHLLAEPAHAGVQKWVADLNAAYRRYPALYEIDFDGRGFEWIDCTDTDASIISLLRHGKNPEDDVVAAFNFTPVPRHDYRVGVNAPGWWYEILNSDSAHYGGSGQGNLGGVEAAPVPLHGRPYSLTLTLPPLGAVFFTRGKPGD
jgi:1,4-alpha-glucan branching enzyme